MSEEIKRSRFFENLNKLDTEEMQLVRIDIDDILRDRAEQEAVDRVAARAVEMINESNEAASAKKPAKRKRKPKAELVADDE